MRLTNLIKATICPLAQNRRKYDFCKISLFILKPYCNSHILTRYISVLSGKKKKKKSSATLFSYQLLGKLIQLWACIAWLDSRAERAGFVFAFGTSGSMICTSNFSQISKAWDCWYFIRTVSVYFMHIGAGRRISLWRNGAEMELYFLILSFT